MARLWGKRPVKWIEDFGFYDVPLFGAHMSGLDVRGDAPFLAGKAKFTSRTARPGRARERAAAAAVHRGAGGRHQHERRHRLALQRPAREPQAGGAVRSPRDSLIDATSPVPVKRPTVWDMIKAVTVNPANGLGRNDLGRIAVGAKADLTSIDVTGFLAGAGAVPPEPLNNLLYANGLHVRNVMTEGVCRSSTGRLVVDDERRVMERGGRVVQKIWAQLERRGGSRRPHVEPFTGPRAGFVSRPCGGPSCPSCSCWR